MKFAEIAAAMEIQKLVEEVHNSERGYTPGLTIRHLHKLRELRERTAMDKAKHSALVSYMYSGFGNWDEVVHHSFCNFGVACGLR